MAPFAIISDIDGLLLEYSEQYLKLSQGLAADFYTNKQFDVEFGPELHGTSELNICESFAQQLITKMRNIGRICICQV